VNQNSIAKIAIVAGEGVSQELLDKAVAAKPFQDWLASLSERFIVKSIRIQTVDMFGPVKVGFIKFSAEATDVKGNKLPGIVFMRGGAVAIVLALTCKGVLKTIFTVQPRIATGSASFRETPAGMLDGSGNFGGVAAKELKEELEMTVEADELIDLTTFAGMPGGIFLSPGGSDETIRIFAVEKEVTEDELRSYEGKCTGVLEEGEQITLEIADFDELLKLNDAKSQIAHTLYKRWVAAKSA